MITTEINFDGIVGPLHNYAGLSLGNVASATNAGGRSMPRAAALQGLAKMRLLIERGIGQGVLPPLRRPATTALRTLGFGGSDHAVLSDAINADPILFHTICSASAMWAANAATVLAASDTNDGRVHLVTANLSTMLHRSFEAPETCQNLKKIFGDNRYFTIHPALPQTRHFSDEGAANHMRLAATHGDAGWNIFVHGDDRHGPFPERQARRAGEAIARMTGLGDRAIHVPQSAKAIQAGAFHNDVVAVANESVLLTHPSAFENQEEVFAGISARLPNWHPIALDNVTLDEAVRSYVFNSQLISLPDGGMMLVLPTEVSDVPAVVSAVDQVIADDNPIKEIMMVDVRESMRNGGGPACLRLRVPVTEAARSAINPAYLLDARRVDRLSELVERWWPEAISPSDLQNPALWDAAAAAHDALDDWFATGA